MSLQAPYSLGSGASPVAMMSAKSAVPQDVIKALEGIELNDIVGPMRVDPATHQTLRPFFFLRCKSKSAMKEELDLADVVATGNTPLPKEYAACKDIGSF